MRLSFGYILFCIILAGCSHQSAYLIDGAASSKREVESLDTSEIFSYKKLGGTQEGSCFPNKEKNSTIIVITTKTIEEEMQRQRHALLNIILDLALTDKEVLVIKEGIIVSAPEMQMLRQMSADQLSNAYVIAKKDAVVLYGSKAKPITLVINTY